MKYNINKSYDINLKNILNIKSIFKTNNNSIHKARNEIKIIKNNNIDYVVKSFKIPNIINKLAYLFFKHSKAKKSYMYALKIKDFTPQPIAYLEYYKKYLLHESYFISEEFKYDFTIREPLIDKKFPQREKIFQLFANFTFELHQHNILHKDYSPGNILIKKIGEDFIFKIVDINRMSFHSLSSKQRAKNFAKLWADEDTLKIIATQYKNLAGYKNNFIDKVIFYSNQHKKFINFKKRLKGIKVVD